MDPRFLEIDLRLTEDEIIDLNRCQLCGEVHFNGLIYCEDAYYNYHVREPDYLDLCPDCYGRWLQDGRFWIENYYGNILREDGSLVITEGEKSVK